jgi:hypothetical protein
MKNTNKIRYAQAVLVAIVAALALSCMILSCAQPEGSISAGGPVGKGSVTITAFPGSSGSGLKTILPAETPEFTRYVVKLTKGDDTKTFDSDDDDDLIDLLEADGYPVPELDAGIWTVTVTAYHDAKAGNGYPVAQGTSDEVAVYAGEPTPITVGLKPLPIDWAGEEDLKGTFSYKVTVPSAATGTLTLGDITPVPLTGAGTPVDGDAAKKYYEDTIEVAPGYYRLSISLEKTDALGTLSAALLEEVHIYIGLDTTGDFEFDDTNFTSTVYFAGKIELPASVTGLTSGTLKTYSDANKTPVPGGELPTLTAFDWVLGIPKGNLAGTTKLYFEAEVKGDDGKTYVVAGDTGTTPLTDAGKPGITLKDDIPPGKVTDLSAVAETHTDNSGKVTLSWTNPADPDFYDAKVTWKPEGGTMGTITEKSGKQTVDITGLTLGLTYQFTVTTVDSVGHETLSNTASAFPPIDSTMSAQDLADLIDKLDPDADINLGSGGLSQTSVLDLGSRTVNITGDFEIPEGVTLKVGEGGKLTVIDGGKLEVKGELEVADGATLTVNGTVKVEVDSTEGYAGTLKVPALKDAPTSGAITFDSDGNVEIQHGAAVYYGVTPVIGPGVAAVGDEEFIYNWQTTGSDTVTLAKDNTTIFAGKFTVAEDTALAVGATIVLPEDSEFTVAEGVTLTVNGTIQLSGENSGSTFIAPELDEDGLPTNGKVEIAGTGKIEISQGATYKYAGAQGTVVVENSGSSALYGWNSNSSDGVLTLKAGNVIEVTDGILEVVNAENVFDGTKIVVANGAEFVVPKDKELTVDEAGAIEVAEGGTLTVAYESGAGTLNVNGALTVAEGAELGVGGTLVVGDTDEGYGGSLTVAGTLTTEADSSVTVDDGSTLTVAESGELTVAKTFKINEGGALNVDGKLTVSGSGATVTVNGNLTVGGTGEVGVTNGALVLNEVIGGTGIVKTGTDGSVSVADVDVLASVLAKSGTGKIAKLKLTESVTLDADTTIPLGLELDIENDKKLTVDDNLVLTLDGTLSGDGAVVTSGTGAYVSVGNKVALTSALAKSGTNKITNLTLTGGVAVTSTDTGVNVLAGATLTLASGVTLTLGSNAKITVKAGGAVAVDGTGLIDARYLKLGEGKWLSSAADVTIEREKITLGSNANAKFGGDDGSDATVLTGTAQNTNTFTVSSTKNATVSLKQDSNKLIIEGALVGAGTKYPTLGLGATAGISEKGGLTITSLTVDISAANTSVIKLENNSVGITLSNSDSVIKLDGDSNVAEVAGDNKKVSNLAIGGGVQVFAESNEASKKIGSFVGASSENTLTASGQAVEIKKGLTTAAGS